MEFLCQIHAQKTVLRKKKKIPLKYQSSATLDQNSATLDQNSATLDQNSDILDQNSCSDLFKFNLGLGFLEG